MRLTVFFVQFLILLSDNYVKSDETTDTESSVIETERQQYASRMISYMDTSVEPCVDFYQYACGNFFNVNKEDEVRGVFGSFFLMNENLKNTLHEMLMEPIDPNSSRNSASNKAKIYYQSCMNEDIFAVKKSEAYIKLIESLGGWPALDKNWKEENFDWFKVASIIKSYGIDVILLELPDPLDGSSKLAIDRFGLFKMTEDILRPYSRNFQMNRELARHIFTIYGLTRQEADKAFNGIIIFGKNLKSLQQKLKFRETEYNLVTLDELEELTPDLDWSEYYSGLYDTEELEKVNITVSNISLLNRLPHLFYGRNIKRAANYIMLKLLFELHDELKYSKNKRKYCLAKAKETLNPVISAMFLISKYHDQYIEDEILAMSSYIRSAFKDSIKRAEWLDKETKQGALKKINAMEIVIGDSQLTLDMDQFDEQLLDVNVSLENGFYQNQLNLRQFATKNDPARKPLKLFYGVDVNAFYNRFQNHLIIPAGIFRRPFYYPELPKAYNFGVIGSILGHEFTHSLDLNGKDRDEFGEDTEWFSEMADKEYEKKLKCFVKQYGGYRMEEIVKNVHGTITLSENISDNGGLRHAFYGYKKWLDANMGSLDMSKQMLPALNMTDTQLFFLSFTQTWCEKIKGYKAYSTYSESSHTPAKWRSIGSLSNFDEFSKAFDCKEGSRMNREEKCVLW